MSSDDDNREEGLYYIPEEFDRHPRDMQIDAESGTTWGEVCDALTFLHEEHNSDGPFTLEQFNEALIDCICSNAISGLMEKGLVEQVMRLDGEMGFKLTEKGKAQGEQLDAIDKESLRRTIEKNSGLDEE